jgi:hypothetical protein
MSPLIGSFVIALSAALALLSPERAVQVDTAADDAHPDQPALYALLADALEQDGPASEIGAVVVDDAALLAEPARFRGQEVVVEGRYAGRQRRIGLQRAGGPWGDAVTEWGIALREPMGAAGDAGIVMVWFADPSGAGAGGGEIVPPRHDAPVRVVGRFLNIWKDVDADGNTVRYPVIVARSATVLPPRKDASVRTGPGLGLILLLMLALVYAVWRLRRWASAGKEDWREARRERLRQKRAKRGVLEDEEVSQEVTGLPRDPAEALRAMTQEPRTK